MASIKRGSEIRVRGGPTKNPDKELFQLNLYFVGSGWGNIVYKPKLKK